MGQFAQKIPILVLTFLFLACGRSTERSLPSASHIPLSDEVVDLKMEKMKVQSFGPRGLEWELRSPHAWGVSAQNKMMAENLHVDLYEKGQKSTAITSDQGIVYSASSSGKPNNDSAVVVQGVILEPGDMFLSGHVVVVSTMGTTLKTDWAHYKQRDEIIVSSAPVKIIRDDSVTEGRGLRATADLREVTIYDQKVLIKSDEQQE